MRESEVILYPMEWVCGHLDCWDISIALLSVFIFCCAVERLTNRGPMLWPVLGIVPSIFAHLNHNYDWCTQSLIKAGGTFHFMVVWMRGAHGMVTLDPQKIEYMLKTNFKNFPKGVSFRERFHDLLGNGIFNDDGVSWKQQRRIAVSEMHSSHFLDRSFQTLQDLVHQKLLKLLEKLVISGVSFDLQELLLRFTFDNICIVGLGIDPGYLVGHGLHADSSNDSSGAMSVTTEILTTRNSDLCLVLESPQVSFAKAFEEATELSLFRFMVPPFVWKPLKYFGLGYENQLKEAIQIVHDFADKTVTERKKELRELGNLENHPDLLSRLLEIQEASQGSFENIHVFPKDFCISFILAGRDTSSVTLAWFFWLIHKNPQVENRILIEIRQVLGLRESKKKQELPNEVVFTEEELRKMVYLQTAISESLRLYPSVPIDFKEAMEEDVFPDGIIIKKGDRVLYCIYSMGRAESIWGEDYLEFKPERWIKEGQFVSHSQFKYAVFNAGPRLCVGKKFAYLQMKMLAASILLRYQVCVVNGQKIIPKLTTTLYMKNGLLVTLKPRSEPIA